MSEIIKPTPCVDDAFMTSKRFQLINNGWVRNDQFIQPNPFGGVTTLKRELKFKIYDVDPLLGTEMYLYVNGNLVGTGYWMDRADFTNTFKGL